jgi:hypothetical protein
LYGFRALGGLDEDGWRVGEGRRPCVFIWLRMRVSVRYSYSFCVEFEFEKRERRRGGKREGVCVRLLPRSSSHLSFSFRLWPALAYCSLFYSLLTSLPHYALPRWAPLFSVGVDRGHVGLWLCYKRAGLSARTVRRQGTGVHA